MLLGRGVLAKIDGIAMCLAVGRRRWEKSGIQKPDQQQQFEHGAPLSLWCSQFAASM